MGLDDSELWPKAHACANGTRSAALQAAESNQFSARSTGSTLTCMSDPRLFELSGRTALVTGASRGIGAAAAVALAAAGARVVGTARSEASLLQTQAAVIAAGGEFAAMACDLTDREAVSALSDRVARAGFEIDILINNAGIARRAPAEEHSDASWDEVLDVDLRAPALLARDLGRDMLDRRWGRIVFLASMMTFQGGRNVASYAAAKSGVAGIVHALANEWTGRGVTVNAVAPGYIRTELTVRSHADEQTNQRFVERIPAGRWGEPEDLAGPIVFLCSEASSYVSGVVLPVDGGWLVR